MRYVIILIIQIFFFPIFGTSQNWDSKDSLRKVLFEKYMDSLKYNRIFTNFEYDENPISFKKQLRIKKLSEPYKTNLKTYSIILENRIVTFLDNGHFFCLDLENFKRDSIFEKRLNIRRFDYTMQIDNKLIGFFKDSTYTFNELNNWQLTQLKIPFDYSPKLYEDDKYLVFKCCCGEFGGGVIYFYNKLNNIITYTHATCPVSLIKQNNNYLLSTALYHLSCQSGIILISNPDSLTKFDLPIQRAEDWCSVLGKFNKSDRLYKSKIFSDFNNGIISSFKLNDRLFHLIRFNLIYYFIAELKDNKYYIVDNLLGYKIFEWESFTTNYSENLVLINLISQDRETGIFIIKNDTITKIEWKY